jgi:hypothetical protein
MRLKFYEVHTTLVWATYMGQVFTTHLMLREINQVCTVQYSSVDHNIL